MIKPEKSDLDGAPMDAEQFRNWRKSLGLKQKDAADALGLKKRMIQYYEKGKREGKRVEIPKSVRLACYALSQGITDYDGKTAVSRPLPKADDTDPHDAPSQPISTPAQPTKASSSSNA